MRQGRKNRGKRCRHPKQMFTFVSGKKLCRVCDSPEIANDEHNYKQYSDLFKGGNKYDN